MPRNFFSGNNCVAEYGQLPSNFLLGVSTPCSDINFRRQMRSRLGEPIAVAGTPPLKFASAETENEQLPDLPALSGPRPPERLLQHRDAARHRWLIFTILYICSLRMGFGPLIGALLALFVDRGPSDLVQRRDQEGFRRQGLGRQSCDALLVLAALRLLFRAGLLFRLVPGTSEVLRRHDPREPHLTVDGMPDRTSNDRDRAHAVLRLERGEIR